MTLLPQTVTIPQTTSTASASSSPAAAAGNGALQEFGDLLSSALETGQAGNSQDRLLKMNAAGLPGTAPRGPGGVAVKATLQTGSPAPVLVMGAAAGTKQLPAPAVAEKKKQQPELEAGEVLGLGTAEVPRIAGPSARPPMTEAQSGVPPGAGVSAASVEAAVLNSRTQEPVAGIIASAPRAIARVSDSALPALPQQAAAKQSEPAAGRPALKKVAAVPNASTDVTNVASPGPLPGTMMPVGQKVAIAQPVAMAGKPAAAAADGPLRTSSSAEPAAAPLEDPISVERASADLPTQVHGMAADITSAPPERARVISMTGTSAAALAGTVAATERSVPPATFVAAQHAAAPSFAEQGPAALPPSGLGAAHTFERLDAGTPWNVTALRTDARNLEVGVQSGSLGWVEVRATTDAMGQVSASLHAQSQIAAQSLASHVDQIAAYAHQHSVTVDQVFLGANTGEGTSHQQQRSEPDTPGTSRHTTPASTPSGGNQDEDSGTRSLSLISVHA